MPSREQNPLGARVGSSDVPQALQIGPSPKKRARTAARFMILRMRMVSKNSPLVLLK